MSSERREEVSSPAGDVDASHGGEHGEHDVGDRGAEHHTVETVTRSSSALHIFLSRIRSKRRAKSGSLPLSLP